MNEHVNLDTTPAAARRSGGDSESRPAGTTAFLLSFQAAAGNRAVASVLQPALRRSQVVQRKVGFEFEVNSPLYQETGKQGIFGDPEKAATSFGKDQKLHDQAEFHVVQDHAATPVEGISTIPEFVIHPVEESLPLDAFLKNVKAAQNFVEEANRRNGLRAFDTTPKAFVSGLTPVRSGGTQATFGVLPEGVPDLFAGKRTRFTKRSALNEAEIMDRAHSAAAQVVEHEALKGSDEKEKIRGFLALICSYCVSNSIRELQEGPALDKNKVPFLVRSTMGEIAKKTLSDRAREELANHKDQLAELIIGLTKAQGSSPIISPTKSEKKKDFNVDALTWVRAALAGNDEPLKWGSLSGGADSKLIPPEQVGAQSGATERDDRPFGAVVEERNLVQGEVSVQKWHEVAAETWAYVRKINRIG